MAVPRAKRGKAGPKADVLKGSGLEVLCKLCPWVFIYSFHRAVGTIEERQETETFQVRDDSGLM